MMAKHEAKFGKPVATPKGIISFPHLVEKETTGEYPSNKYKVTLLMPKDADFTKLRESAQAVLDEAFPGKGLKLKDLGEQQPFRNGDNKDVDGYAGKVFLICKTGKKPLCVDRNKQTIDNGDVTYGDEARLVVKACSYVLSGKPGVTFLLDTVQKIADGGVGGGNVGALDDEYADEDGPGAAAAALDDGDDDSNPWD
jgi:hypothetical protein